MRPILQTQSAKLKTCTLTVISTFFGLGGLCKAMLPTLGLSLRMLSPTCVQTCPSCTMLDPSWGQVGPKLEPTGPSSAQVTPKLGPSRLPFAPTLGQERPSLTPVGFWLGQVGPLLSSLSYSLGVGSCRREATRISKSSCDGELLGGRPSSRPTCLASP